MAGLAPDQQRSQGLDRLSDGVLDLLVVGGGIVGAGVARDAAMRGLATGLIEQYDFAFGTSGRSSRLLHGGLRYLAQGRIGLVRESSREKRIIHSIAPHLARPLAFLFPTYRGSPWPKWKLRIGVRIYDLLCGGNFGRSSVLNCRQMLSKVDCLADSRLTGGVRYFDAMTGDARLVIDTLRCARRHGAMICNQTRLVEVERAADEWACRVKDVRRGKTFEVRSRGIVNATGPWSGRLPPGNARLHLTKGVHLVVDRERLPLPEAVVIPFGKRILFAIPWGERVILGTTDTDYDGPVASPRCEASDRDYVLDAVNGQFRGLQLSSQDIVSRWAGLRPLVYEPHGSPSEISRAHRITMPAPGWWDVTGGKLTTYRKMAEQTVDRAARFLKADVQPCRTAREPLLESTEDAAFSGVEPPEVRPEVVAHYCANEWALDLCDVMLRRSNWHFYHRDRQAIGHRVAGWMAETLQWNETELSQQRANYEGLLDNDA